MLGVHQMHHIASQNYHRRAGVTHTSIRGLSSTEFTDGFSSRNIVDDNRVLITAHSASYVRAVGTECQ
jgi:hypothetical protein